MSPVGGPRLLHHEGELAVARAARHAGIPYAISTLDTVPIERIARETDGNLWFQLYLWGDRSVAKELLTRAQELGYRALLVSVDVSVRSKRERELHAGVELPTPKLTFRTFLDGALHPSWSWHFLTSEAIGFPNVEAVGGGSEGSPALEDMFDGTLCWDDLAWIRDIWTGPIALKGILSPDDARRAAPDRGSAASVRQPCPVHTCCASQKGPSSVPKIVPRVTVSSVTVTSHVREVRLKLVGYVRVSTLGQVEDGQGLEIQEHSIREWTRHHSHRLSTIYRDEGVSGSTDDREGLEDALAAIKFNGVAGLVVPSIDRLARSLTVQEAALQQVWASGGRVFAVDSGEVLPDDPDDPIRTFVRQILGAVSQLEAALIARRLRRGRKHKSDGGGYAHGAPPFGYRAEGGSLIADPSEQGLVGVMVDLRRDGRSFREIAGYLNGSGILSKRGGRWHPQTVARVLNRAEAQLAQRARASVRGSRRPGDSTL